MPKKILYESAIHQILCAARAHRVRLEAVDPAKARQLRRWVAELCFSEIPQGQLLVSWQVPVAGSYSLSLKAARFYTRGDASVHCQKQAAAGLLMQNDAIMGANRELFEHEFDQIVSAAKLFDAGALAGESADARHHDNRAAARKRAEEAFHDEWAANEDIANINVLKRNEACTAPEMRYLRAALGDIRGRRLLDVGCGLGEASVYFALQGADVTATDISPGMCEAAQRLAELNGVALRTHVSAIEDLGLPTVEQFDIIYTGNTLHHADIDAMLGNIVRHLKPSGVFVSWDPVAYNPVINVYRAIATKVRTPDEHPLRLKDIRTIKGHFAATEVQWFWLTTLVVFILMAVIQLRSPNKERYWKTVIDEADTWAWLYKPLERLDRVLLAFLPVLRPLCWNVAIVAKGPINKQAEVGGFSPPASVDDRP